MRNVSGIWFYLSFLAVFCTSVPLFAQNEAWKEAVFWVELDPVYQSGEDYPVTPDIAAQRALEEARFLFSGMLFGFRFRYIPSDRVRNVKEEFSLQLLHQIPWGDPGLSPIDISPRDNQIDFRIRYTLAEHHIYRLSSWGSNTNPVSAGIGESPTTFGYRGKIKALQEAVKTAVRGYGREQTYNKPREMTGEVLISGVPSIIIDGGSYTASVKIKLRNVKILAYKSF